MNKQKKILVIDDDHTMGGTLKNLLTTYNYTVYLATSGSEGIQKAFEIVPDLVLCDLKMVPVDGFQVINTLKESSITRLIPFVFLTGKSDLDDIRLGMQMGADDYVVKPFNNDELIISIETRLKKYDMHFEQNLLDLYSLISLIPSSVIVFEEEQIVVANASVLKMLGFDKDELLGQPLSGLIPQGEKGHQMKLLNRVFLGLAPQGKLDLVLIRKDGSEIQVEICYFQTRLFRGKPHFLGLIMPKVIKQHNEPMFDSLVPVFPARDFNRLQKILAEEGTQISSNLADLLNKIFIDNPQLQVNKKIKNPAENEVRLSRREHEVVELSCQGLAIKEIADKLCISDRTVEKHRASIMEKTGSRNIVETVIFLIRYGLISV